MKKINNRTTLVKRKVNLNHDWIIRDSKKQESILRGTLNMTRDRGFNTEIASFFKGVNLDVLLQEGSNVLDLGCGTGELLKFFSFKYQINPYGIDLNNFLKCKYWLYNSGGKLSEEEKNELSSRIDNKLQQPIQFQVANITSLPFKENTFDFIYSFATFMYVQDKLKGLTEAHRVLKVGATAAIDLYHYNLNQKIGLETTIQKGGMIGRELISPPIEKIFDLYPNRGQISLEDTNIIENDIIIYTSKRVLIKKNSDAPLEFPRYLATFFAPSDPGLDKYGSSGLGMCSYSP